MDTILIDAPARTVAAALAEPWLLRESLVPLGIQVRTRRDQLAAGDDLVVRMLGLPLTLRVEQADEHGLVVSAVGMRITATVTATDAGTLLAAPKALLDVVRHRAEQLRAAPIVVGAVIVGDGRDSGRGGSVLAAQRERPRSEAGRWEFPGGKVEPGEPEPAAVARECREELGVDIEVGERLGPDLILANGWVLRLYLARLASGQMPVAGEHRELRWVAEADIDHLDWLDADRVVLPSVRRALRATR